MGRAGARGVVGDAVNEASPPTPEEQITFLLNVQRLLAEGSFVATYKFALLHALADLAVLRGDDSGATLTLRTAEISERVTRLYWAQAAPHQAGHHLHVITAAGVASENFPQLLQNTGSDQAAILQKITKSAGIERGGPGRVGRDAEAWNRLVRDVDATVRRMPLWKLQTVGDTTIPFLYQNDPDPNARQITLKPGVAWCLRAYHELVTSLVQGAWLRFVQRRNPGLSAGADLSSFLFGSDRASLTAYVAPLMDVQGGKCLYCDEAVRSHPVVDHFVPWSRYPVDLGHNFVLAHGRCNADKSDLLGAERHLHRWVERNDRHGPGT